MLPGPAATRSELTPKLSAWRIPLAPARLHRIRIGGYDWQVFLAIDVGPTTVKRKSDCWV